MANTNKSSFIFCFGQLLQMSSKKVFRPGKGAYELAKDYFKKITTPTNHTSFLTPAEKVQYRENLRKRLKYGVLGLFGTVFTIVTLYQRWAGTEKSRLDYHIAQHLSEDLKELSEVELRVQKLISKACK
ncbi:1 TM domain-containing transmembrane protein [Acrasis kona]|uniref:1 TM domain-containing transmembrane protein n=1 Tax=Acrasis kona TaxID=1008807 RepID=A0AAW2Z969_9EUKA